MCSECADGFGPYRRANCIDDWYGQEFVPITVFYINIIYLAFQISVTSAPMPCFIMYAQIIVITFDSATSSTPMLQKIIPKEK